jgi:chromosome segregation protein
MFKLDRVEISGFKSFYDRVDLSFPGYVTAVVGPNGCGKSNICDAVAWALGEQSAKILRGERMDDVIFNGSARRRPLGMAEVILTLSRRGNGSKKAGNGNGNGDGNGNGHGEDSEEETLRIGRRVYREGHGEYFLNDKMVRLKDIQDRLLGTGLGVRAYSVIEQGRIDQVLSTKPQDRRRLIEEAAGITRYKLKKRLAEAKLEETRGNLLRISDILTEIERNVASLKRQASRAARYKEKSEALRTRRGWLARARHDRLLAAAAECETVAKRCRDAEAQAASALARSEADLASARLAAADAASERDRLRESVASLEAAIQRDDALLEANRRAMADLLERRAGLERDGRDVAAEQARAAREMADLEQRLARALEEARSRSLAREEADRRAVEAAAALAELERELDAARAEALSAAGARVASRNARHEVDVEASRAAASLAALAEARQRLEAELAHRAAETARVESEHGAISEEATAARADVAAWEAEISRVAREILETEAERERAKEALGAAEHRGAALRELLSSREGTAHRFQEALDTSGIPHGGLLSDRLRPARGWEAAVDLVLGDELEAVLSVPEASRALALSRALPCAGLVRADWSAADAGATDYSGWEAVLENFGELAPSERAALPPAGFVEGLAEALALSEAHPRVTFVSRGRELVRGSFVRAANHAPEAAGVFSARRELADLEARAAERQASVGALERSLDDLRRERAAREAEMPARRERESDASARLSAALARLEERRTERERSERELSAVRAESEALEREAASLQERRGVLEAAERADAQRELALRDRADALSARVPETRSVATAAAEELSHRRTEAEVAAERRRSAEAARQRLLETGAALDRRLEDASEEARRLAARSQELASEEQAARERRTASLSARQTAAAELDTASATAAEASARVDRAEESTRTERVALDAAREARFEAEVSQTRVAADLDHLVSQTRDEFGVEPGQLAPPENASPEALEAVEKEAAELADAIEKIGPVNVLAWEEYQQETERLTFLSAQRDDLLKSIAELQESIRRINATSSDRFRHAFEAINENFKAMFTRLFQGGTAEMRLLDENDLLESGVEIVAQPPGKRNQSILLLSGGEKAMTAVALLMAIFRYRPSPFCVLDEVDAPLDEVNIGRFTSLLRDMTDETQFIAITHNKRTMETADVMYGVTMEEPGCSKIVSVKFD